VSWQEEEEEEDDDDGVRFETKPKSLKRINKTNEPK
jgi:hypothetical protein